eukprot:UN24196
MQETTKENIISLDNGCLCCQVRGDLSKAFMTILEGVTKGTFDIEGVLVETTGMANPAPVVGTFEQIPNIKTKMRLDCIVTVVAANHILSHLEGKSLRLDDEEKKQIKSKKTIKIKKKIKIKRKMMKLSKLIQKKEKVEWGPPLKKKTNGKMDTEEEGDDKKKKETNQ